MAQDCSSSEFASHGCFDRCCNELEGKLHEHLESAISLVVRIGFQFIAVCSGCGLYFWVKSVFRFRLRSDCRRFGGLQSGASGFSLSRSRGGFRRPVNGGRRASGREHQRASWQARHGTQSSAIRMPLVKGGRQSPARRQMLPRKLALGRLPRLEGWPRRNHLTKRIWDAPTLKHMR